MQSKVGDFPPLLPTLADLYKNAGISHIAHAITHIIGNMRYTNSCILAKKIIFDLDYMKYNGNKSVHISDF